MTSRVALPVDARKVLAKLSQLCQETCEMFRESEDLSNTAALSAQLNKLLQIYNKFYSYKHPVKDECRRIAGELFVNAGVIPIMSRVLVDGLKSTQTSAVMYLAMHMLHTLTDASAEVTYAVIDEKHLLPTLLEFARQWAEFLDAVHEDIMEGCLGIIHNTAMRDNNVPRVRQMGATAVLVPYLNSPNDNFRLIAVAVLANIATEDEADTLVTSPDVVEFLLGLLAAALQADDHRGAGWSVTELVRAVRQLARNDANKQLLGQIGVLPMLTVAAESDDEDERMESFSALWRLSFCKENHEVFIENERLMDVVRKAMYDSKEAVPCREAAEGIMWQLRTELEKREKLQYWAKEFMQKIAIQRKAKSEEKPMSAGTPTTPKKTYGHVMLSYNWDHQALVKKIRDRLAENRIQVWMDLQEMRDSLRESMAVAVENAIIVLCCISRQYKDSSSCRAEAEYAADNKKKIIPVKVQNYSPDGWLGLLIAGKLYYDFSDRKQFDSKFQELLTAIREVIESKDSTDGQAVEQPIVASHATSITTQPPATPSAIDEQKIKAWTARDVQTLLTETGLSGPKFEKFNGRLLIRLHSMYTKDADGFYDYVENKLDLDPFESASLSEAVDKLPKL
ncbi:hypothetical protein BaRGS_00036526 [Batillaria attramentaria]|uniref:TIR domain-containing protein n=1 Tax=Batillaria attramentaria TaxID=370345 RepID=A0ABD0JBL7_9CAEN